MARLPRPRPRAALPDPLFDHRPLTSRVLDVVARAGRPVTTDELDGAFPDGPARIQAAIDELVRRGRVTTSAAGVTWWQPTRDLRPALPIV